MAKKKRPKKSRDVLSSNKFSPELKARLADSQTRVVDFSDAPDEMRLSDRILRLIDPYMEQVDMTLLVDCAVIAWNESIFEDYDVSDSYSLNNVLIDYRKHRELIDTLKARKRILFADNSRHIKKTEFYPVGDGTRLNVISSFGFEPIFSQALSNMRNDFVLKDDDEDDDTLPDLDPFEDDYDMSKPNLHLKRVLLSVVDDQIQDNTPPIARETFERLQAEGYTAMQAKEKIAAVLIDDIYDVLFANKPHDAVAYAARLNALN